MAEFRLGRLKFVWKGAWAASTEFIKDDVVRNGGKSYVCKETHTSNTNFYTDLANLKWDLMNDGISWRGDWATSQYYKTGDLVSFGGGVYICSLPHTSGASFSDSTNWEIFVSGLEYENTWSNSTEYQIGDIVAYGGYTYKAKTRNTGNTPSTSTANWEPFLEGINLRAGEWTTGTAYKTGDLVRYGGNNFLCIADTSSQAPTNATYWTLFSEGIQWVGVWSDASVTYRVGEVVKDGVSTYICIQENTSDFSHANQPINDTTNTYWEIFSEGASEAIVSVRGDLVYRNNIGAARLPIGTQRQVLAVNSAGQEPEWTDTINVLGTALTTQGDLLYRDSTGAERLPIGTLGTAHTDHQGILKQVQPVLVVNAAGTEPEWSKTAHLGCEAIHVDNHLVVGPDTGQVGSIFIGEDAQTYLADDGPYVGYVGLTDTRLLAVWDVNSFGQFALKNINDGASASTDLILYTDDGDNDSGWIDMGITSSGFDASSGYGITDVHDGYIFMSAPTGSTGPGNLVIATNDTGTQNDIVFATGGFDITTNTDAEKMRIIGEPRMGAMFTGSISGTTLTVTAIASGTILFDGKHTINATGLIAGTVITAQLTGTAGSTGTYTVNKQQTLSSTSFTQDQDAAGVEIYINTAATNPYTGALRVQGGVGIEGDLDLEGTIEAYGGAIYQGTDGAITARMLTIDNSVSPGYVGLTDASGVFTGHANSFVQFALKNFSTGDSASTDCIMYSSNGDNDSGWIDMGITSENYDDPTFTVTGPSTGYIFMSAPAGTTATGNLLVGTDATGTENDIVFFTNGFDAGNEKLRIVGEDRVGKAAGVEIYADTESTSSTTGALRVDGGVGIVGNLNVGGNVAIVGTISIGGAGSSLSTTTLAVSDPMIKMGKGNASDSIDLGFYGIHSTVSSTLNGAINNSVTSIALVNAASFPSSGTAFIDDEEITWSGKSTNTLTGVTRGANGTTAASHLTGATIFVPKYSGLVRDASDSTFRLFKDITGLSPTSTIDFTSATYSDLYVGALVMPGSSSNITVNTDKFTVTASSGNTSIGGTLAVTSTTTLSGNLAVNASALTTNQGTFALINTGATTVNFAGAATALNIGASSGTTKINNSVAVGIGASSASAALHVGSANSYAGGLLLGEAGSKSGYISTTDNLYVKPNTSANTASGSFFIQNFSGSNVFTCDTSTGNITVTGSVSDSKGDLRRVPQNAQTSAYTLVAADAGKHVSITTGGVTVPASVFSVGDCISIYNNSGSNQTITQGGSVTLYQGGTANTGNRTIAQRGFVTLVCVASNTFVASGSGLT